MSAPNLIERNPQYGSFSLHDELAIHLRDERAETCVGARRT